MGKCVVIGGGIAGVLTALSLSEKGKDVILIESKNELLLGSSDSTPCRVGVGFHYIDKETALLYLCSTLTFLKKYQEFLLPVEGQLSGSDYAIVCGKTLFSYSQVAEVHSEIVKKYTALCVEEASNQLLGHPDKLINYSWPLNYIAIPVILFNTVERILDWPKLRIHLISEIQRVSHIPLNQGNVTVLYNSEVIALQHGVDSFHGLYSVELSNHTLINTDCIINSAWESTEFLNSTINIPYLVERTCRLKAMAIIKLPPDALHIRTTFFCFGPHCAITNTGDGYAYLTFEPVTNLSQTTDLKLPEEMRFWVKQGNELAITPEAIQQNPKSREKFEIGQRIIQGSMNYIPLLKNAELIDVRFGIVKTTGKVDIADSNSAHHARADHGVSEQMLGLMTNESRKLLYGVENALTVSKLAEEHLSCTEMLNKTVKQLACNPNKEQAIKAYVSRYYGAFFNPRNNKPLTEERLFSDLFLLDRNVRFSINEEALQRHKALLKNR